MQTVVDDRLRSEVRRFNLRFTCEHCAHFDPEGREPEDRHGREGASEHASPGACSQGFPADDHRQASLEGRSALVFCKMFEAC